MRLKKTAQRDIRRLDRPAQKRIVARLAELARQPRPAGAELLAGQADVWRVRVGHRREIYRLSLPSGTLTAEEDEDGGPDEA